MPDKSNFTPDEWKLLLESVMVAGIAVSAAEPSGLWGLLKESFAEGSALMTAKLDPGADALIKAVVADFETAEGRSTARDGLKEKLTSSKPAEIKAKCIETLREAVRWWMPRRQTMQRPSKAGCARSANTLPRHRRRADFLASAACA
jgi:hypothetical protein